MKKRPRLAATSPTKAVTLRAMPGMARVLSPTSSRTPGSWCSTGSWAGAGTSRARVSRRDMPSGNLPVSTGRSRPAAAFIKRENTARSELSQSSTSSAQNTTARTSAAPTACSAASTTAGSGPASPRRPFFLSEDAPIAQTPDAATRRVPSTSSVRRAAFTVANLSGRVRRCVGRALWWTSRAAGARRAPLRRRLPPRRGRQWRPAPSRRL